MTNGVRSSLVMTCQYRWQTIPTISFSSMDSFVQRHANSAPDTPSSKTQQKHLLRSAISVFHEAGIAHRTDQNYNPGMRSSHRVGGLQGPAGRTAPRCNRALWRLASRDVAQSAARWVTPKSGATSLVHISSWPVRRSRPECVKQV